MKVYVINGPNLNMLGIREPGHYGTLTYGQLLVNIKKHCDDIGAEVEFFQSNHEGDLVDWIQKAYFENITLKSRIAIFLMKKQHIRTAFYFLNFCKKLKRS